MTSLSDESYSRKMKLTIRKVSPRDFSSYRCVAKNSLGETDGLIRLDGTSTRLYPPILSRRLCAANSIIYHRKTLYRVYRQFPALMLIPERAIELFAFGAFWVDIMYKNMCVFFINRASKMKLCGRNL